MRRLSSEEMQCTGSGSCGGRRIATLIANGCALTGAVVGMLTTLDYGKALVKGIQWRRACVKFCKS